MRIHVLGSRVSDNFFYLLSADDGSHGILIDPVDAELALETAAAEQIDLRYLVNTHGHPDHVSGNEAVRRHANVQVCAHRLDAPRVGHVDEIWEGGESLRVGTLTLTVLHTPGHTPGHISLYGQGHLFCGDTLFVAGAGNCKFGGDAKRLFTTFRDVLGALPDDTRCYSGHNYAARNLKFALEIEPDNAAGQEKLAHAQNQSGHCLSTLAEERAYNPFLRVGTATVQAAVRRLRPEMALEPGDEELTFIRLRALRDTW
jgi:hydroxyacylglutathione hydrolase